MSNPFLFKTTLSIEFLLYFLFFFFSFSFFSERFFGRKMSNGVHSNICTIWAFVDSHQVIITWFKQLWCVQVNYSVCAPERKGWQMSTLNLSILIYLLLRQHSLGWGRLENTTKDQQFTTKKAKVTQGHINKHRGTLTT